MTSKSKKNSIYTKMLLNEKIPLEFKYVNKLLTSNLLEYLKKKFEGKCCDSGYIKDDSINIISYSSGIVKNNLIVFEVAFEAFVCYLVEGIEINCIAKNITKAGIRAELDMDKTPAIIFIARDHHYVNKMFSKVQEGDNINVKIIGQRYELNDINISAIAELITINKIDKISKKINKKIVSHDTKDSKKESDEKESDEKESDEKESDEKESKKEIKDIIEEKAEESKEVPKEEVEEVPKEELPKEELPKEEVPKEEVPKEEVPKEEVPKEELPKEEVPKEEVPKEELPKEEVPKEEVPKEEGEEVPEINKNINKSKEMQEAVEALEAVELDGLELLNTNIDKESKQDIDKKITIVSDKEVPIKRKRGRPKKNA